MNIKVIAGPHHYVDCPLTAPVEVHDLGSGEGSLVDEQGHRIPCQLYTDKGSPAVAWIEPSMAPGQTKVYKLDTQPAGAGSKVEIEDAGESRLEVRIGDDLVTTYHYSEEYPRPFLYPLVGPGGQQVTRHYPMRDDIPSEDHDHPHHRSLWIAYGDVNGTDNWSEGKEHAWIKHVRFQEVTGGPVFGRIRSLNTWTNKDGAKQMEDIREFTFYNTPTERIVDISVRLVATSGDVVLGDTKEGGIVSVRVASSMDGSKGGTIVNSYGGRTEAETWGKPAHWVDYSGPVDGSTMGITIMDHPSSFRYPARWHVRDYGLFTANPFALKAYEPTRDWDGSHTIRGGEDLGFCYRLLVHEGDSDQANVRERYFGYVAAPKVEVE